MSDLVFADGKNDTYPHGSWKILVVDNDPGIHAITRTVLRDVVFENRTLEFLSAYSSAEAKNLIENDDEIAVIIMDIVIEEENSGLELVRYIREVKCNPLVRIILQTDQPGKIPSQQVIVESDINDYEEKADLTAQRLFTTVIASLRNHRDLLNLEEKRAILTSHRIGLSRISRASTALFGAKTTYDFSLEAYNQFLSLFENGVDVPSSFVALQDGTDFEVIRGHGKYHGREGAGPKDLIGESSLEMMRMLMRDNRNLSIQEGAVSLYEDARKFRLLLHVADIGQMEFQDRQILDIFAANVSLAFENLRLKRDIVGTQEDLMSRLGGVVETRSHDTEQHVTRVAECCGLLARWIGMDEEYIHDLKLASVLHDVGKIGIPDEILLKPGPLGEEEYEIIKEHTQIGYNLLKNSMRPLLQKASVICLQHHEHYDGGGYPSGIKGEEIHIDARIVGICDVFDSLSHGRAHREGWSLDKTVEYMKEKRGSTFDPVLLDLFLENIDDFIEINKRYPDD